MPLAYADAKKGSRLKVLFKGTRYYAKCTNVTKLGIHVNFGPKHQSSVLIVKKGQVQDFCEQVPDSEKEAYEKEVSAPAP